MSSEALIEIIGIAFDAKSSWLRGAAQAPARIREELMSSAYNPYSEALNNVLDPKKIAFRHILKVAEYDQIQPLVEGVTGPGRRYLFLGGDHSISYPLIRRMHALYGRFHVLHFDAHGDLYDTFDGDRHSHACPFARIMEDQLVDSLTQVGIRALTPHQQEQAARFGIDVITMNEVSRFDPDSLSGPLYISVDVDAFDPGFAPGVAHLESGGLEPRTVIGWIQSIRQPVIGADLVEYNPLRDIGGVTAALCYKLVKEILATFVRNPIKG